MCPSPAARPVRLALERVRAFNMPRGARVLALGAPSLREGLVPHGFQIPAADPAVLDLAPESFDAAVIVNGTGREPWPRWTLQTVHGALKPGAPLALVAPLLFSAATLLDGAGLAEMARKQVRKLGPRDAAAPVSSPRRQRVGRVVAMLEHLGYRVESRSAHRVTGDLVLVARRESELFGDPPRRPWPDAAAHRARFERDHRDMIAARDRWLAARPAYATGGPATPIEPSRYAGRSVLVLSPHPDDELLGCGGTLARLVAAAARVTVIQATDGGQAASLIDAPDAVRRTVRLDEARAVGRAMGFAVEAWAEPNGAFRERDDLVARLAATLTELRPALLFTPFVADVHPEHRTLTRLLGRALDSLPRPLEAEVLAYAVWCLVPANRYAVVSAEMDAVARALALYVTAMKVEDYIHIAQDRNYWDAVTLTGERGFVESFHAVPAAEFPALAATTEGSHG